MLDYNSNVQPRNFIGITLPEDLSSNIELVQRELLIPGQVMEPLVPHITLLPPQCLETLAPAYIRSQVESVAKSHLPLAIHLGKTALFDRRIIYISVDETGLQELHGALISLLPDKTRAAYIVGREFIPHITIAQAKPKQELADDLIYTYRERIDSLLPQDFTVRHLTHFTRVAPRRYKLEQI